MKRTTTKHIEVSVWHDMLRVFCVRYSVHLCCRFSRDETITARRFYIGNKVLVKLMCVHKLPAQVRI